MALLERLEILIDADGKAARSEFESIGRSAEKDLGKAEARIGKMSAGLISNGTQMALAGGIATAGVFALAQAAGDYGEAASAAGVIFGDSSDDVEAFGKAAIDSAGLSRRAAVEAANSFGTFGKAAGLTGNDLASFSTDLTQLAGDMASFKNTTTEEAITAIGAALRGESEPIRKYGVLLDDATLKAEAMELGIYSGVGALTQQQKVLAAQAAIFKQTSDAQGDYARTSDSLSNQTRSFTAEIENLKVGLGEGAVPVFSELVGAANSALDSFQKLSPEAQTLIGKVGAIGAVGTTAIGAVGVLAGGALRAVDGFKGLGASMRDADGNMGKVGRTASVVGGAIGAAGLAFTVYQLAQAFNDATADTVGFDTALNNLRSSSSGTANFDRQIADGAAATAGKVDDLSDAFYRVTTAGADVGKIDIGGFTVQIDDLTDYLDKLYKEDPEQLSRVLDRLGNIEDLRPNNLGAEASAEFDNLANSVDGYRKNLDSAAKSSKTGFESFRGGIDLYRKSVDDAAGSTSDFGTELDDVNKLIKLSGDLYDLAGDRADNYLKRISNSSRLDDLITSQLALRDSSKELLDGLGALQGVDIASFALGAKDISDEAAAALGDVAGAAGDAQAQIANMLEMYGADAAIGKADSLRAGFTKMFDAAGLNNRQITDLLDSMGLLPEQVNTAITLSGTDMAIAQLTLLRDFYTNKDGTSGIPAEIETQVQLAVSEQRFTDAANLISLWVQDTQDGLITNPLLISLGLADTADVKASISDLAGEPGTPKEIQVQVGVALNEDRLTDAANLLALWKQDKEDGIINDPLLVAMGLGDTAPASGEVDAWKADEEAKPPARVPVGADTGIARHDVGILYQDIGKLHPEVTVGLTLSQSGRDLLNSVGGTRAFGAAGPGGNGYQSYNGFGPGGADGDPLTPLKMGGEASPGNAYKVNEMGLEMFRPSTAGFVMNASDTDRLISGVEKLVAGTGAGVVVNQQITTADPVQAGSESARKMRDATFLVSN